MAENGRAHCQMCRATVSGVGEDPPLFKGVNLTGEQKEKAAEWIRGINSEYVAPLLPLQLKMKKFTTCLCLTKLL